MELQRARAANHVRSGEYQRAERDLLRALQLFPSKPPPTRIEANRSEPTADHLATWNELGMVYKYLGKFARARKCYHHAQRHVDSCLSGSDRCDFLANLYHNFGGLEHSQRRFRQAEPLARKSVEYRLRVRPRTTVALAADRVALAAILDGLGKFAESKKLYLGALRTYRRAFGESHREIALVLNNLATVYQMTAQPRRAERMYRAALAMKVETLGRSHPDVAVTMNNLAMLLADERRVSEARALLETAARVLEKKLGPRHPNAVAIQRNLERLNARGCSTARSKSTKRV